MQREGYLSCANNVNRAVLEGVSPKPGATAGAVPVRAPTWIGKPARRRHTGKRLARRASRLAKFSVNRTWAGWDLGAEWQLSNRRYDNVANTNALGGYGLSTHRQPRAQPIGRCRRWKQCRQQAP